MVHWTDKIHLKTPASTKNKEGAQAVGVKSIYKPAHVDKRILRAASIMGPEGGPLGAMQHRDFNIAEPLYANYVLPKAPKESLHKLDLHISSWRSQTITAHQQQAPLVIYEDWWSIKRCQISLFVRRGRRVHSAVRHFAWNRGRNNKGKVDLL